MIAATPRHLEPIDDRATPTAASDGLAQGGLIILVLVCTNTSIADNLAFLGSVFHVSAAAPLQSSWRLLEFAGCSGAGLGAILAATYVLEFRGRKLFAGFIALSTFAVFVYLPALRRGQLSYDVLRALWNGRMYGANVFRLLDSPAATDQASATYGWNPKAVAFWRCSLRRLPTA